MSIMQELKLSKTAQKRDVSEEFRLRTKVIEGLERQLEAAQAQANGETYVHKVRRWIADPETGHKTLQEVPSRFRPWWWQDEKGKLFLGIRYGSDWLEFKPEHTSIEVGSEDKLSPAIEKLIEAVRAGELDSALKKAADARRVQRRAARARS